MIWRVDKNSRRVKELSWQRTGAGRGGTENGYRPYQPWSIVNGWQGRANIEGVSSAADRMEIRTALFGKEVSKIKEGKDEYKIQLRNNAIQRKSLDELLNMKVTFRDMAAGGAIKNVPIINLVKVDYTNTLAA